MTVRKFTARALWAAGEWVRMAAFMAMAYLILRSIVPASSGAQPAGPSGSVFVHTLALLGVVHLAVTLRDFGTRLGSNNPR